MYAESHPYPINVCVYFLLCAKIARIILDNQTQTSSSGANHVFQQALFLFTAENKSGISTCHKLQCLGYSWHPTIGHLLWCCLVWCSVLTVVQCVNSGTRCVTLLCVMSLHGTICYSPSHFLLSDVIMGMHESDKRM